MAQQSAKHSIAFTNFFGVFNDNAFKMVCAQTLTAHLTGAEAIAKTAMIILVFNLPFVLFSTFSGWTGDRFARDKVLKSAKLFEIGIMIAAMLFVLPFSKGLELDQTALISVIFLMSLQSTFFSPARLGILPQFYSKSEISEVNGYIESVGFLAILLGGTFGTVCYQWDFIAYTFPIIAVLGFLCSLRIPKTEASDKGLKFNLNVFSEVYQNLSMIARKKNIFLCALGEAFFYMIGTGLTVLILSFLTSESDILGQTITAPEKLKIYNGTLAIFLSVGMGIGCFLAGKLSRNKVELGLVPLGGIGMTFCLFILSFVNSYTAAAATIAWIGLFGGFFIIPLKAFLQEFAPKKEKNRILATSNFIAFAAMIFISWAINVLSQKGFSLKDLILMMASLNFVLGLLALIRLPEFLLRFLVVSLTRTIYRVKTRGAEHIPEEGAVLLLPNHVSWVDGLLISAATSRPVCFMISDAYYNKPVLKPLFKWMGYIPVPEKKTPKNVKATLDAGRQALSEGKVVCIFPEGQITRSGLLNEFKSGFTRMLPEDTDVTIVPTHLGLVWGSIFSMKDGEKIKFRKPTRLPFPVTITFGEKLTKDCGTFEARQRVIELSQSVEDEAYINEKPLHNSFLRHAKRHPFQKLIQDSTGEPLNNFNVIVRSFALRNYLELNAHADEKHIGILLPTSTTGVITSLACMFADKVPVFINFTVTKDAVFHAIKKCKMKRILTSRQFLRKVPMDLPEDVEIIYLEDLRKTLPKSCKRKAMMQALLPSSYIINKYCPKSGNDIHTTATVLFSSGSTGTPKGVVLSHHNFTSNLSSLLRMIDLQKDDVVLGTMPLFHCFGFLSAFWMPIMNHNKFVFHPNPMEAAKVGEIVQEHDIHVLMGTPTFLNAYARKCKPEQLQSLRIVLSGAEKLRKNIAEKFKETSGVYPVEAYGATELSPCVSVNVPNKIWDLGKKQGKEGTVGHPIAGVQVKTVDPETYEELENGEEGLLFVHGPGVMQGYLDEPEKTAEVLKDGWYNTGDMAKIDPDGYITLTGRLSRFSKIGGEMVPHGAIEEAMHDILGGSDTQVVITSRPCPTKGEKLYALHLGLDEKIPEMLAELKARQVPNLWIPKANNFVKVEEFPMLGSGKLDLSKLNGLELG